MPDNCLFCKIIKRETPADILYEDDDILAFRDIAPQAPVHFLVITKKHISGPSEVAGEDEQLMGKLIRVGSKLAEQEGAEHFRMVFNNGEQAGQAVFHIHLHILGGRDLRWPPG